MRKLLSKTFIFIGVLSLVLGIFNTVAYNITYAEDLELRGTDLGLEIIPSTSKLFDLQNINPGDSKDGKITIKNNYEAAFDLFMRAERNVENNPAPLAGEADLFDKLILTVNFRGNQIYSGTMNDFAKTNLPLGRFQPNDIEDMTARVELPGPGTGNEYQGKVVDVNWIFTATSDGPPETPDPGPGPGPRPRPSRPRDPEEVEITLDEVPLGEPEVIEEEKLEEIKIDEVPLGEPDKVKDRPTISRGFLPKTGQLSPMMFYGSGISLLLIGTALGFKKKK